MRITKRQLRRIVRESCGLAAEEPVQEQMQDMLSLDAAEEEVTPEVPVPEDYDAVRDMLSQNPDLVDIGIGMVMDMAGTSCERSTAQGIIDHLQDMLDGAGEEEFSYTGDVAELPGEEAFGIGYNAGIRGLE